MRPVDWSPVGLAADPVPGDAVLVLAGGNDYLEVADSIQRAGRRIAQLGAGGMVSDALDALMARKEDVASDIARAHARYAETGQALVDYAATLSASQAESLAALDRARVAVADADGARGRRRYYLDLADTAQPEDRPRWERLAERSEGDALDADAVVSAARAEVDEAVVRRAQAAGHAASRIHEITSSDGVNDGWWENWGADVLSVITDVAGWVSTVAGVLALAVSWIPVIGQAAAAALLIVSAVAAVVNAIGNIVLAATGERTWTEAVISIVGAALAGVGLGGAARVLGRIVTTRVLLREASNSIMERAARKGATAFAARHLVRLVRNDPKALWESTRAWVGAFHADVAAPSVGQRVYRVYGDQPGFEWGAAADGKSWTPVDPRTLLNARSTMGLPTGLESHAYNAADNLVVAEVVDPSRITGVRHGLPLDGNPGGAPEFIIQDPLTSGILRVLKDAPLAAAL